MTGPHMLHVTDTGAMIEHPPSCGDTGTCVFAAAEPTLPGDLGWVHRDGYLMPATDDDWQMSIPRPKPGRYVIEYHGGFRLPWRIQHGIEPEARKVVRHYCPGCGKSRANRSDAVAHVERCWKLPANRGCRTCRHFAPADSEQDEQGYTYASWPDSCDAEDGPEIDGPIIGCPLWESAEDGAR